jgi:DNA replication and repair protein RecF
VWIGSLQLHDFRNYEQLLTQFKPGLNLIYGENGQGKTNLAEAIYFLATNSSHRSSTNSALIRQGQPRATVSATVNHRNREIVLAAEINQVGANRYFLNGNQKRKASETIGVIQALIFSPEDLDIVRRDPSDRRRFLDESLVLVKPRLLAVRQDYERVLKQRNALLKSARSVAKPDLSTLDIWDEQLVRLGTELISARIELVKSLQPIISGFYKALSDSQDQIQLSVETTILGIDEEQLQDAAELQTADLEAAFHEKLLQLRDKELDRGITLIGPHRDEMVITKAGLPARSHSSQGEAWSLALGLKLALGEIIRSGSNTGDPVLILDDVFAVLDAGRRSRLTQFVSGYEQVLITSADKDTAPVLDWAMELEIAKGVASET